MQEENKHLLMEFRRVIQTQEITTVQQVNQTRTGVRSVFVLKLLEGL